LHLQLVICKKMLVRKLAPYRTACWQYLDPYMSTMQNYFGNKAPQKGVFCVYTELLSGA